MTFARSVALGSALATLLLLAACTEEPSAEEPSAEGSSQQTAPASDPAGAGPSEAPAGTLQAGNAQTGNAQAGSAAGGIDTSGTGPASIPPGRYTTTESGLKYYDLEEGSGASPEGPTSRVRVHYAGWLQENGQQFDSSYDRGEPITFALNRVIPGWTEGLQSMQVGGTRQLVIPSDLAYGPQGSGPIPPGATLVFEVELLGIEGQQQ